MHIYERILSLAVYIENKGSVIYAQEKLGTEKVHFEIINIIFVSYISRV
jgi:hypothetical protein